MDVKSKVYRENVDIVDKLSKRLGISFTSALNKIVCDWELTRQTKEKSRRVNDGRSKEEEV